jgi:nanoRNase/pAp phosphatase (c-di-AMP/oligoRNAs hydrolase)
MTKLDELIRIIKNKNIFIQMHNYPDQDALASAFGLQSLLSFKGIKSTICFNGQIDKHNTIKMIEMLHIEVYNISDLKIQETDEIILVDGQKGNVNMETLYGDEIACIDHHPMQDVTGYLFFDIRNDLGACSTIIGEYFIENNIPITSDVATALIYGIKMDTANLSRRVSYKDIDIFCILYKKANIDTLRIFENCSLRKSDLAAYQDAISNLKINGRIGIAKIGDDCSEAIIGSISDFLLALTEVDFTLVYSYRVGGLKFSVRSEANTVDAGKVIKEALNGLGDGGGHPTMAAGFVPNLNQNDVIKVAKLVEQRVIDIVTKIEK